MIMAFVDLPSPSQFIASTTDWSAPLFQTFLPFIWISVGVLIFILCVRLILILFVIKTNPYASEEASWWERFKGL